jgi:hypothetical protein
MSTLKQQVLDEMAVISQKLREKDPEYDVLLGKLLMVNMHGETFESGVTYSILLHERALENIEKRKFETMMKGKTDGKRND